MESPDGKASYVQFLQDQVNRLNAILREYQRQYMSLQEEEINPDDTLPPWLTNPSLLSPLLVEYDNNIKGLKDKIQLYENEHEKLKGKADRIVDENTRLHNELRKSVEGQLDNLKHYDGSAGINQLTLDRLNHQLEIISEEKNNYIELWEAAAEEANSAKDALKEKSFELSGRLSELGVLQDDLQKARQYAEDLQNANQKLKVEHETFLQTAQIQDQELNKLKEDLRKHKLELKTTKHQNEELISNLQKLQDQIKVLTEDSDRVNIIEKSSEQAIKELQNTILTLELRSTTAMEEVNQLRVEKRDFEETIAMLQKKNGDLERREYQATIHVRDSVQLVENAMLEKDQSIMREQQKTHEVSRLQETIDKMLNDAEKAKNEQFVFLKKLHKDQLANAKQEIHLLEVESAEKQAQLDRIAREKSSLEKEIEKLYQSGFPDAMVSNDELDDLQRRLAKVEIARDEALLHIESLQTRMQRNEDRHTIERNGWDAQLKDARRRISTAQSQSEGISSSRLKLVEDIDKLKRDVMNAEQVRDEAEMSCAKQVAHLKQKLELDEKNHESRLHASEDLNRRTVDELRDMLNAQRRNGTKWREESKSQAQKFENATADMRQDIIRLKRKNNELAQLIATEQHRAMELEQQVSISADAHERLQRIAADSEAKCETAAIQIQTLLYREKELLKERKQLNRDVDKLKLDLVRVNRDTNGNAARWSSLLDDDGHDIHPHLDTIPRTIYD